MKIKAFAAPVGKCVEDDVIIRHTYKHLRKSGMRREVTRIFIIALIDIGRHSA